MSSSSSAAMHVDDSSPTAMPILFSPPPPTPMPAVPPILSPCIAFLALHVGAGYLHESHHSELLHVLQSAANAAFTQSSTLEEAVMIALSHLEDSPLTNAGVGSCLTEDGRVECESSIVLGNGTVGSCGGVSGVNNPIQIAYHLASERDSTGLIKELGRVRPLMLVAEGAYLYAQQRHLQIAPKDRIPEYQVTERTRSTWMLYKRLIEQHRASMKQWEMAQQKERNNKRIDYNNDDSEKNYGHSIHSNTNTNTNSPPSSSSFSLTEPPTGFLPEAQGGNPASTPDTVGAIACDYNGRVVAASSSGGVWMKHPGRIGSSGIIGCGCYAENGMDYSEDDENETKDQKQEIHSVAASASGCGEDIMEQFMSLRCCQLMKEIDGEKQQNQRQQPQNPSIRPLERIMQQLIVKKQLPRGTLTGARKRYRNTTGSCNTHEEDGGLSSGLIALRVVTPAKSATNSPTSLTQSASSTLELDFTYAHTSQHFALGYVVANNNGNPYEENFWVSTLGEAEMTDRDMRMGEIHFKINPPANQ